MTEPSAYKTAYITHPMDEQHEVVGAMRRMMSDLWERAWTVRQVDIHLGEPEYGPYVADLKVMQALDAKICSIFGTDLLAKDETRWVYYCCGGGGGIDSYYFKPPTK
jgi:hypothetical protein